MAGREKLFSDFPQKATFIGPWIIAQAACAIVECGEEKGTPEIHGLMVANYRQAIDTHIVGNGDLKRALEKALTKKDCGARLWRKWKGVKKTVTELCSIWAEKTPGGICPSGQSVDDVLYSIRQEMHTRNCTKRASRKTKKGDDEDTEDDEEEEEVVEEAKVEEVVGTDEVQAIIVPTMKKSFYPPCWLVFVKMGPPSGSNIWPGFAGGTVEIGVWQVVLLKKNLILLKTYQIFIFLNLYLNQCDEATPPHLHDEDKHNAEPMHLSEQHYPAQLQ